MSDMHGVNYAAFIVPGLTMLSVLTESISNASFGIYMPRFTGTIYEVLSAPMSAFEIVMGYVGAATFKSMILGVIILIVSRCFVHYEVMHPFVMIGFLALISISFCLFGFIIGLWAEGFEQLQIIPLMIITPLTFLGGSFYSIDMLPPFWQKVSLFNPIVYLINGFRWSFFGVADVSIGASLGLTSCFLAICLFIIWLIFRTGYKIKQ
jgi:ABC-2 type transport system permease protein